MRDFGKRILVTLVIALCIGLMFIGGTFGQASGVGAKIDDSHQRLEKAGMDVHMQGRSGVAKE